MKNKTRATALGKETTMERSNEIGGKTGEPAKRVIAGCNHTLPRMAEWADEGGCPICLTASLGMSNDEIARLRAALMGIAGLRMKYPKDPIATANEALQIADAALKTPNLEGNRPR